MYIIHSHKAYWFRDDIVVELSRVVNGNIVDIVELASQLHTTYNITIPHLPTYYMYSPTAGSKFIARSYYITKPRVNGSRWLTEMSTSGVSFLLWVTSEA